MVGDALVACLFWGEEVVAQSCVANEATAGPRVRVLAEPLNAPLLLPAPFALAPLGDLYVDLNARWVAADPPNVLAFPGIFEAFKLQHMRRLRAALGDGTIQAALGE
jgi:hypothetical protein